MLNQRAMITSRVNPVVIQVDDEFIKGVYEFSVVDPGLNEPNNIKRNISYNSNLSTHFLGGFYIRNERRNRLREEMKE